MAAYNPATYTPGDPWETIEHFQRGAAAPRISEVLAAAGDATTPSYFEFRECRTGNPRTFAAVFQYEAGAGAFLAVLERSYDNGATWVHVTCTSSECSQDVSITQLAMYRIRLDSVDAGTTIRASLIQNL